MTSQEQLSLKMIFPLALMHFLALLGLFFLNLKNLPWLVFSHYFFVLFGVSTTLHRFVSHRSFKVQSFFLRCLFFAIATLTLQGSLLFWAANHRYHHRFVNNFQDPHSRQRGFLWSHFVWLCYKNPNGFCLATGYRKMFDLIKDPLIIWYEKNYLTLNLLFASFVFISCVAFNRIDLFFILIPLRIVLGWHSTWLLNSFSHSLNNPRWDVLKVFIMNILIPGEGDHTAHHIYPNRLPFSRKDVPQHVLQKTHNF